MNQAQKLFKYLVIAQLLLFGDICLAQNDTLVPSIAEIPVNEPEWYFTDTLIHQLNRNKYYKNWTSITLTDQIYPNYLHTFLYSPTKNKVRVTDTSGTNLKSVSKKKIDELIGYLVEVIKLSDSIVVEANQWLYDPMSQYQLDSLWYKENIISIWDEYREIQSIILDSSHLKTASEVLLNYQDLIRILSNPNNWNPNEQVMVDLKIEYPIGTLHIQATSYFSYALPWYYFNNQTRLYNSIISDWIGGLLFFADKDSKNVDRLLGVGFQMQLMHDIYTRYLKEKINIH